MMGLTEEQVFYLVVVLLGLPILIVALKFGFFMTLPQFILKRFFMTDYNTKRKKDMKRKEREAKKRARRG